MSKILAIAISDLRIFFSDKANLVGLLLIPAVLTIILGTLSGTGGDESLSIVVLDLDQSQDSAQFIEAVSGANPNFAMQMSDETQAILLKRLEDGEMNALLIIPTGFEEAVQSFSTIQVHFYSNEDFSSPSAIQQSIEAVVGKWNTAIVAERVGQAVATELGAVVETGAIYQRASEMVTQEPVRYDYQLTARGTQLGTGFSQSVPGMGSMFVMFTIFGGLTLLIKERQQWTLARLVVMPVSRSEILGGKILGYFILGMIQYGVVFLIGLLFGMNFGADLLAFFLVAMAFALCVTALTFAIAPQLRTEGQASQLTTLLSLALAALGGAWWPLEIVPDFMKIAGHFSPVAWAMDGFQDLLFYGGNLMNVLPEIGVLLAIAAVCFAIGIMRFRYE